MCALFYDVVCPREEPDALRRKWMGEVPLAFLKTRAKYCASENPASRAISFALSEDARRRFFAALTRSESW